MKQILETVKKYKKIIISALVIVGLMFAYNVFYLQPKKEQEGAGSIRSENQSITSTELGREIITTLNRLKEINIDPDFFKEERFQRLVDFSVEIEPQPVGKQNPFQEVEVVNTGSQEVEGTQALEDAVEVDNQTGSSGSNQTQSGVNPGN